MTDSAPPDLLGFYAGTGRDHRGRALADIHAFTHGRLEAEHDFIQWLFPLPSASRYNAQAPLLDDAVLTEFAARSELGHNLRKSLELMLHFYGFEILERGSDVQVVRGPRWAELSRSWLTRGNHNFLRISRILRSLSLLGQKRLAEAFLAALEGAYRDNVVVIGPMTIAYWRGAVAQPHA